MKPLEALATLEQAVRQMTLKADDHDKLRACVQALFEWIKMKEASAVEVLPKE